MARKVYDESGRPIYSEQAPGEAQSEGSRDYEANQGKPTYEVERGEVPQYLRDKQDYRYRPSSGRYVIYDKENKRFMDENGNPSQERMSDSDNEYFTQAKRVENPVMRAMESGDASMEKARNSGSQPVTRATELAPGALDRIEADMPSRARTNIPSNTVDIARTVPSGDNAVKAAAKIKEAKDFLQVLSNRKKSNSKYRKQ